MTAPVTQASGLDQIAAMADADAERGEIRAGEMPANLRFVPLVAVMAFLLATIALFFWGPFVWPIRNTESVALYLACQMLVIAGGFILGVGGPARACVLPQWQRLYMAGAIASCVIIFPATWVYTGKLPWDAAAALFDQGQAYRDFQDRISELDGTRWPMVLARTLTHWLEYAVIPLAVLHWRTLTLPMRLGLLGAVLAQASFSILRGTDQGTFDLAYMFGAAAFVGLARHCLNTRTTMASVIWTRTGVGLIVGAVLLGGLILDIFVERKASRYDNNIADLCIGEEAQICMDPRHPLMRELGERGRFGFGMVTAYAAQGYYGLALSLPRAFHSTYGIGHSTILTRIYEAATGDTKLYEHSFTYRLRDDAWSDLYQWSSIYTWIANDIGFPLTIPCIGFFAWIWGRAWRDAIKGGNDAAAIVFLMMTQTFLYSSANFQLLLVADTYAAVLVWLGIWMATTRWGYSRTGAQTP